MSKVSVGEKRPGTMCAEARACSVPDRMVISGELRSPIGLAEHLVEFGVGPERPDLLRTAAGGGDLGRPLQRLLARGHLDDHSVGGKCWLGLGRAET